MWLTDWVINVRSTRPELQTLYCLILKTWVWDIIYIYIYLSFINLSLLVVRAHEGSLRIQRNFEGGAHCLSFSTTYLHQKYHAAEFSWESMSGGNGFDLILVLSIKPPKMVLHGLWYAFCQRFREEFRQPVYLFIFGTRETVAVPLSLQLRSWKIEIMWWLKPRCVPLSAHHAAAVLTGLCLT